jgi:hypothetical protein
MSSKAPVWDWEGSYDCPECGEEFFFMREDGWEQMNGWRLQVYHDHTEDPEGVWRAAAFKTWKGRRVPEIVKEVRTQHAHARKARQGQRTAPRHH